MEYDTCCCCCSFLDGTVNAAAVVVEDVSTRWPNGGATATVVGAAGQQFAKMLEQEWILKLSEIFQTVKRYYLKSIQRSQRDW
eukprot:scaffold11877_cov54-Cylindrotheca_fusiformis.AAC.3